VWKAERFSWWTTMTLRRIRENPYDQKLQLAELDYLFRSDAAATTFPRITSDCHTEAPSYQTKNACGITKPSITISA
jgi:hypothetical protein